MKEAESLLIEIGFPGRNPNLNLAGFPPPS
jgi:hypothetical protein